MTVSDQILFVFHRYEKEERDNQMAGISEMMSMVKGEIIPIIYGENVGQALTNEETMKTTTDHWYTGYSVFLGKDIVPPRFSHQERQIFFTELKFCTWADPFLYNKYSNGII